MSDTITFQGVILKSFRRSLSAGVAKFAANYPTKRVCDEMGWDGMSVGTVSAKMKGELHASHMVLEPKEDGLKKHRVKMDVTGMSGFESFRLELEGHRGKGHRLELRFETGFVEAGACKQLEQFIMTCGEAKCSLTVSYVKQAELALGAESDETAEAEESDD
jgi:hypothetical protein